jgi:hypothetical protein
MRRTRCRHLSPSATALAASVIRGPGQWDSTLRAGLTKQPLERVVRFSPFAAVAGLEEEGKLRVPLRLDMSLLAA